MIIVPMYVGVTQRIECLWYNLASIDFAALFCSFGVGDIIWFDSVHPLLCLKCCEGSSSFVFFLVFFYCSSRNIFWILHSTQYLYNKVAGGFFHAKVCFDVLFLVLSDGGVMVDLRRGR